MPYEFKNASVLVVDDMPPIANLLRQILGIFGFSDIFIARDGNTAFDLVCQHDPDIILTDWIMPGMNGLELTEKIRNNPQSPNPFVPIIMVTGFCSRQHVERARDSGVNEFLTKPFSSYDLYTRLEQAIENPRSFVKTEHFFGPDRRRKIESNYDGDKKRDADDSAQMRTGRVQALYNTTQPKDILAQLRTETQKLLSDD